jgi:hypothetical protein
LSGAPFLYSSPSSKGCRKGLFPVTLPGMLKWSGMLYCSSVWKFCLHNKKISSLIVGTQTLIYLFHSLQQCLCIQSNAKYQNMILNIYILIFYVIQTLVCASLQSPYVVKICNIWLHDLGYFHSLNKSDFSARINFLEIQFSHLKFKDIVFICMKDVKMILWNGLNNYYNAHNSCSEKLFMGADIYM